MKTDVLTLHCFCIVQVITLEALHAKPGTSANSVEPDETARNEPSHQDLHYLPVCFDYWLTYLFITMDMSRFIDGKVYFINSGWKGSHPLISEGYLHNQARHCSIAIVEQMRNIKRQFGLKKVIYGVHWSAKKLTDTDQMFWMSICVGPQCSAWHVTGR